MHAVCDLFRDDAYVIHCEMGAGAVCLKHFDCCRHFKGVREAESFRVSNTRSRVRGEVEGKFWGG
jgi:hypothetical protein